MASTTIDTETELSAVNSILGAIGQSPVTVISGNTNPEISFIYNLLRDANVDVQNEGWHFNTEKHVNYKPGTNNKITIADDILKMDVSNGWSHRVYDVVKRNGVLYDKLDHTDDWSNAATSGIDLDIVKLFTFEDLPSVFQRYIILMASGRAATQLVGNPQLVQLLAQRESYARAACLEYECNQGDHNFMGWPDESAYQSYKPYTSLRR